jgi:DNA protecting protein DprA
LWRLWVAGFGMMQVMMYAYPVYIADGDMTPDIESLMRWASLVLTLPVIFYSSAPFFRNAWRDLRLRRVGMDVPVALGVGAAFVASCWATWVAAGEVYFDSVTMFVFFLLGGRFLEMSARQKAVGVTEALARLLPAFAQKMPNFPVDRGCEQKLVADLVAGDFVLVKPGEIIPADGRVIEGRSAANESLLTGESKPVEKAPGDAVTGGAINTDSPLVVQVLQVGEGTRLSAIIHLMERAATEKPQIVELADRVADTVIVSGLAFGIDTACHRAALAFGMPTVGIIASALPGITPAQHTAVARDMIEHGGAVVSELHSQTRQNGNFYHSRNRLLAGISGGTVVVESPVEGGSMDTARLADGYNRTLMAVPGRATDFASAGTNLLIRTQRAQMVCTGEDIVREMMWDQNRPGDLIDRPTAAPAALTRDEEGLLGCFRTDDPISAEELCELSGLGFGELSALLLGLEMAGAVRQLPGNRYMKLR